MEDLDLTQHIYSEIEVSADSHDIRRKVGQLEILSEKKVFSLYEGPNTIGRDKTANISINHRTLSKIHACIHINDGNCSVQDNQSQNKTYIGKRALHPWQLYQLFGKENNITFGDLSCKVLISNEDTCDDTDSLTASEPDSVSMIPEDDISLDAIFDSTFDDDELSKSVSKDSYIICESPHEEITNSCKLVNCVSSQSNDNISTNLPQIMIGQLINKDKACSKVTDKFSGIKNKELSNAVSQESQEMCSQEFKYTKTSIGHSKTSAVFFDSYLSTESPKSIKDRDRKSLEDKPKVVSISPRHKEDFHLNSLVNHSLPGSSLVTPDLIKLPAYSSEIQEHSVESNSIDDMYMQATQAYCITENSMDVQCGNTEEQTQVFAGANILTNDTQDFCLPSQKYIDHVDLVENNDSVIGENIVSNNKCSNTISNNSCSNTVSNNSCSNTVFDKGYNNSFINDEENHSVANIKEGNSISNNGYNNTVSNNGYNGSVVVVGHGQVVVGHGENNSVLNKGSCISNNQSKNNVSNNGYNDSVVNVEESYDVSNVGEGYCVSRNRFSDGVANKETYSSIANKGDSDKVSNNNEGDSVINGSDKVSNNNEGVINGSDKVSNNNEGVINGDNSITKQKKSVQKRKKVQTRKSLSCVSIAGNETNIESLKHTQKDCVESKSYLRTRKSLRICKTNDGSGSTFEILNKEVTKNEKSKSNNKVKLKKRKVFTKEKEEEKELVNKIVTNELVDITDINLEMKICLEVVEEKKHVKKRNKNSISSSEKDFEKETHLICKNKESIKNEPMESHCFTNVIDLGSNQNIKLHKQKETIKEYSPQDIKPIVKRKITENNSEKFIIKRKSIDNNESDNSLIEKNSSSNKENSFNTLLSKSLSKRRLSSTKPKIVFTGVTDKKIEKIVTELGGELVDNVGLATHLVTDKVRRTVKFLCAVARGIPIVSLEWLKAGKTASMFVPHHQHLLEDIDAEHQYNFRLVKSLETAAHTCLFENLQIYVTRSVKPEPKAIKEMIEFSGGKFLHKAPTKYMENTYIVSCMEDHKEILKFEKLNYKILSNEFILTGILLQKFAPDQYRLTS